MSGDAEASDEGRFNPKALDALFRAGWRPGRQVDIEFWRARLADEFTMHSAAERFLAEFGGLVISFGGRLTGMPNQAWDLDPLCGEDDEGVLEEWGEEIGRSLFPIGAALVGPPSLLAMDEIGELYDVGDVMASYGRMPTAMERLLLGKRPDALFPQCARDEAIPRQAGKPQERQQSVKRFRRVAYRRDPKES